MSHGLLRVGILTAAAAAATTLTVAPAQAGAPSGCPPSYEVLLVADLTALGYRVPAQVDNPTSGSRSFGQAGNGNGWVCALPLGNQTTPFGTQIYNFWDDTLRS